jgi:FkbM family methyltransferase
MSVFSKVTLSSQGGIGPSDYVLRAIGHTGFRGVRRFVRTFAPPRNVSQPFTVRAHGFRYQGDLSEFIDWNIYYFGSYAKAELKFLSTCANILRDRSKNVVFLDIGANVGEHSLVMSREVSEVHSFEPSSEMTSRLERNIAINQLTNIKVHRVALGAEDCEAELGSGFEGNSGSRSLLWSFPGKKTERVRVRQVRRVLEENGIDRVHIVKIDVEGYEKRVLQGFGSRLHADRPIVLMELIGKQEKGGFASPSELRQLLYPDHCLKSFVTRGENYRVADFDWHCESAIIFPGELSDVIVSRAAG